MPLVVECTCKKKGSSQGFGIGVKCLTPTFPKFLTPTPVFPKFPTSTPQHKGNEIWLLKSMEIMVHSKKSVSTKVSKETVPFQQEFQIQECDVKNDPIGHLESELDKKI